MNDTLFPEHEKLEKVASQSQQIGEFLEWLNHCGIILARVPKHRVRLQPYMRSTETLLAEYFEIDLRKLEEEKRAMLWSIRNGLQI